MKRYALIAALILVPTVAYGHGAAQWIQDGGFRSARGTTCCTDHDCFRGGVANLVRAGDGFDFDATANGKTYHVHVPMESVHGSVDASAWFCGLPQDLMSGFVRCLFLPGSV